MLGRMYTRLKASFPKGIYKTWGNGGGGGGGGGGSGGGGFFLACEDFGRMFDHSFPACVFFWFFFFVFFFFKVEIS